MQQVFHFSEESGIKDKTFHHRVQSKVKWASEKIELIKCDLFYCTVARYRESFLRLRFQSSSRKSLKIDSGMPQAQLTLEFVRQSHDDDSSSPSPRAPKQQHLPKKHRRAGKLFQGNISSTDSKLNQLNPIPRSVWNEMK